MEMQKGPDALLAAAQANAREWGSFARVMGTQASQLAILLARTEQLQAELETAPSLPEWVPELDRARECLAVAVLGSESAVASMESALFDVGWVRDRARSLAAAVAARKDQAAAAGAPAASASGPVYFDVGES